MEFLIKEDVVQINAMTIQRHGGNFVHTSNFLNESSLDYCLEVVNADLFGEPMYPSLPDKAAFYMFSIVTGHIFQDGNKRTGFAAALLFLKLNSFKLTDLLERMNVDEGRYIPEIGNTVDEILENFTLEMAAGKISLHEARLWFAANTQPIA